MATLNELLDRQIRSQEAERARLVEQHEANLKAIDATLAILQSAKPFLTREFEAAYAAMLKAGLVPDVDTQRR